MIHGGTDIMGAARAYVLLALPVLATACNNGAEQVVGQYYIDVERTAHELAEAERGSFRKANRQNSALYDIYEDGTWKATLNVAGKLFIRKGSWHMTGATFQFTPKKLNGELVEAVPVAVRRDGHHLVWKEKEHTIYLAPGTPPMDGFQDPTLPDADRGSPVKIDAFLSDIDSVDDGKAAIKDVFRKYNHKVIRWTGLVKGRGGQDVRVRVGRIDVELSQQSPGVGELSPGMIVQFEGKITSLNLAPWVYLREARVLSARAAPPR